MPAIRSLLPLAAALTFAASAFAQPPPDLRDRVRAWRADRELAILDELRQLLSIPNVASDRENIARNAALLRQMLERRGASTRLLTVEGSPPAVYGELNAPGATRTVVMYVHYDGQPVDPAQWASPPWTPTLRTAALHEGGEVVPWEKVRVPVPGGYRIYARSASDDKSPIVAILAALDALRANDVPLSVNLKFFLEGEEEAGSPNLRAMLATHRDLLQADAWIFADGPLHQSRRPTVDFGVRGVLDLEITTYGPVRPLHSGHYGNWVPNPAVELAHVLTGMRDDEGRILVDGIDDLVRPLSATEKAAVADFPDQGPELRHEFAMGRSERLRERLIEAVMLPAMNVRGLRSGRVGEEATNAIPTEAQASIDWRLVPDVTPEKVRELVEGHLRRRGYHIVHETPDLDARRQHARLVRLDWGAGYPGFGTSMDLPVSRAVIGVLAEHHGGPIIRMPPSGGSLPLYLFAEILETPLVMVPIVNHDNNQHAANENLRLQNLWDGIETFAALLARLGQAWE